jgi:uncharacterized membrane protein YccF (DUF307 family)
MKMGLLLSISFLMIGIILCVTIIGIPFGLQCFKLAQLYFWPFGSEVVLNFNEHPIANIIWIIFVGWELFIGCITAAVIFCITIIGIPFAKQWLKLAQLSLIPFGADIK